MTPERARLIQSLAREEVANIALSRADTDKRRHYWRMVEDDWTERAAAAGFDDFERREFERVRMEFAEILRRAAALHPKIRGLNSARKGTCYISML